MGDEKFNIRVYGILINDKNELLVTDEFRFGMLMTKFPGGGLHYGEGTHECLKRECREEFNTAIDVINHYYTTDFFQKSAFDDKQLISIYYTIKVDDWFKIKFTNKKFDFEEKDGSQNFRWVKINNKLPDEFTFPIDKIVAGKLAEEIN